ncbi:MAG: phosphoribosylformylglycinamidine synthase [Alphaproteobacteria bacterium]|nr:phosphoribosylformylglycinamidine synthase [Alphaproteobacteria bacterium]
MTTRIEVLAHIDDGRAKTLEKAIKAKGKSAAVRVADIYTSEHAKASSDAFTQSLANPVTQETNTTPNDFDWALEIGFLPGVTDNIGHTASELLSLAGADNDNDVFSSRLYYIKGNLDKSDIEDIANTLSNSLIQRATIKSAAEFKADDGMDTIIPHVTLSTTGNTAADIVDLNGLSDEQLMEISQKGIQNRGPLGLPLVYMKAIQEYYAKQDKPATDIELETIAQTWSEHCKHTIFASPIDDVKDGLYKGFIKRATKEIRAAKGENDICVSVFSDNAGGIIFDDNYLITDKVETHNSPSALDPFGGAITGIVGVNRDCIGFGQGAKPVINRYGFCLADPRTSPEYYRDKALTNPILSPETIMKGVIDGVESGGNQSGIPTPQGFVTFDDRFVGKPLVFVGTIGLIPRTINGKPGHKKKANAGDKIVVAGGRVGRDGIHGATFSSVALDEGSPATAVQIGDPITQKKMSDAIIKEIRDLGWYSAITDNGAGGMSSSIGEMAEQSGGFHVELERVPLKYPGMAPWEIWISESQERMTMAVPPENTDKLIALFAKRGVEATIVGTYTDDERAKITYNGETIMDMDMDFLHDGNPETPLTTTFTRGGEPEPNIAEPSDHAQTLMEMMGRLNICSKEFISTQYDHNVQGTAVLGPLQGAGRVYAETSITKPVLTSEKGVVLSQGLFPRYSDIDTGAMAAAGVDLAVRNAIAAGADLNQLALLDNFCWCSSDEPERLGQLKRAVEAIYEVAVKYETPYVSGKDSMFNDFKGFNADGSAVKISAPPTLLASSIGVIPNIDRAISLAPKAVGDLVYLLGATKDECGAGEYYDHLGHTGNNVPETDTHQALRLYKLYGRASRDKLIASAYALNHGGLGAALAKKAIAGQLGMDIDLSNIDLRTDKTLYSESTGRILVTVAPQNKEKFEKNFKGFEDLHQIGHIAHTNKLSIRNVLDADIKALEKAYKSPLSEY